MVYPEFHSKHKVNFAWKLQATLEVLSYQLRSQTPPAQFWCQTARKLGAEQYLWPPENKITLSKSCGKVCHSVIVWGESLARGAKPGKEKNFSLNEEVNFREKALRSTRIRGVNVDVSCEREKLFISPILLHFPGSRQREIAHLFEKKWSFYNILVFWRHLGLSGGQILFTIDYVCCHSITPS